MEENLEQSQAELETPEAEVEEVEETEVQDTAEEEVESETDTELEESQPEDDDEEIEHNGERYKVPKALKPLLMFQQDYTKKTQEVAEVRKAVEAERVAFNEQRELYQAHFQEVAAITNIENQLQQFVNVDWQKLIDDDPVQAMKLDRQYQSLKEAHAQTVGKIQQAQQQMALSKQQETVKRVEQAKQALAEEFNGWTPEVASELTPYLKSYERLGMSDQLLSALHNGEYGALPIVWARKAQLYDQLVQKTAKKPQLKPPPKPVTKVGAKATVTKDPSQMTDKEFAAWRQKQIKSRN